MKIKKKKHLDTIYDHPMNQIVGMFGNSGEIKNPRQDSYYIPSNSDVKIKEKIYNKDIQKQNDLRLIEHLQEKSRNKYEPTQAIKNAKAIAAVSQFSPEPISNLAARTVGTVWDLGTSLKYGLDGQYKKSEEDLVQAGINWIPFLKQEKMINLAKNTPSLAYQFNQLIPKINQGINYLQKGNDVKTTTEAFSNGGSSIKGTSENITPVIKERNPILQQAEIPHNTLWNKYNEFPDSKYTDIPGVQEDGFSGESEDLNNAEQYNTRVSKSGRVFKYKNYKQ